MTSSYSYMTPAMQARRQEQGYQHGKRLLAVFEAEQKLVQSFTNQGVALSIQNLELMKHYFEVAGTYSNAPECLERVKKYLEEYNAKQAGFKENYEAGKRQYASLREKERAFDHFPSRDEIKLFKPNLAVIKRHFEDARGYFDAEKCLAEVSRHLSRYESGAYMMDFLNRLTDADVEVITTVTKERGIAVTEEMKPRIQMCAYKAFYDQAVAIEGDISAITGLTQEQVDQEYDRSREALTQLEESASKSADAVVPPLSVSGVEDVGSADIEVVAEPAADDVKFPDADDTDKSDDHVGVPYHASAMLQFLQTVVVASDTSSAVNAAPAMLSAKN